MGVDKQCMKNFKEVKTEIEKIESDERLHCPEADRLTKPDLEIAQAILVSQLEVLYWILDESMPDYECQKYKSSIQSSVT